MESDQGSESTSGVWADDADDDDDDNDISIDDINASYCNDKRDDDDGDEDDDVNGAVQGPINREPAEKLNPALYGKKSKIRAL